EEPVVTLNNQPLTVTTAVPNQVKFILPQGQGQNLPLKVTLGTESDTVPYSYTAPSIASVSGAPATQGGSTIVISGSNFGLSSGGSVTIGGVGASVGSWSHTSITATVPEGQGTGIPVQVTAGGQASNLGSFDYAPPSVNTVSAASRPTAGGVTVTVTGSNFGTLAAVTVGGAAATVSSQTHTTLDFLLPAGEGSTNDLIVDVSGQASTPVNFAYDPPVINSISPPGGVSTEETEITLDGLNFGSAPAVTIGGAAGTIVSSTDSEIVFTRPAGATGCLAVDVQAGDQTSEHVHFQSSALTCPPGYFIDTGTSTVQPAPAGSYTPDPNMTSVLPAPLGFYTPIPGMSAPIPASPGYYVPVEGSSAQLAAPVGQFSPVAGATFPTPAPPGSYVPIPGMQAAIPADLGFVVPSLGASAQTPAAPGFFVDSPGATMATSAPAGTYAPIAGMRAAIPAPDGTYVPDPGSTGTLPVPPGFSTDGSQLFALPQVEIVAYNLLTNGDHELTFSTDASETYGIFYSENLIDLDLIQTEPGTGGDVQVTLTPPSSTTTKRFWLVAPVEVP
ncbi:MAG: hypothetical protein HKO57_15195, partial [Akkermansiaceae bacterium]|nr:hypothetical protein [Akkermansiaceae bacterium]